MPISTELCPVLLAGSIFILMPGADCALTMRNTLSYSRLSGLFTALGISCGYAIHSTYSVFGVGTLILQSSVMFHVLKTGGALYLIYLGVQSFTGSNPSIEGTQLLPQKTTINKLTAFRIGLLGNLLKPLDLIFFPALFTQIIHPETVFLTQVFYGLLFSVLSLFWFSSIVVGLSQGWMKRTLVGDSHLLGKIAAIILISLGLRLLTLPNLG